VQFFASALTGASREEAEGGVTPGAGGSCCLVVSAAAFFWHACLLAMPVCCCRFEAWAPAIHALLLDKEKEKWTILALASASLVLTKPTACAGTHAC